MERESFEAFMRRCLHHPSKGYYTKNIRGIGGRGDFTTAPQLSPAPAMAVATWAARAMKTHRTRNLIEVGPGNGTLSHQVLRHLNFPFRSLAKLHLVETSPTLAARQKKTLGRKARLHPDMSSAIRACSGNAIIFSNELVDAFPVRLFQSCGGTWREIALDHSGNHLRETLLPPARLPPSSVFELKFQDGQRVEVHDSYRKWLESWLPSWRRGEILTIDYGAPVEQLYHRRPGGTLRAYLLHQRLEGPAIYQNPGLQDITADVNFTDLQLWSRPWLSAGKPANLAEFVRPFTTPAETHFLHACENFLTIAQTRKQNTNTDLGHPID